MIPATAILASLIAGSVTTAGILAVRRHADWGKRTAPSSPGSRPAS